MNWKIAASLLVLSTAPLFAIDVRAEMRRAAETGRNASGLLTRNEVRTFWSSGTGPLLYRVNVAKGELGYFQVDPATGVKSPAFDHQAFATSLAAVAKQPADPKRLPLDSLDAPDAGSIRFRAFGKSWRYGRADHQIVADDFKPKETTLLSPERAMRGTRRNGENVELTIENATDGPIEMFWVAGGGDRTSYGKVAPGASATQNTYAGHMWLMTAADGSPLAGVEAADAPSVARITGRVRGGPQQGGRRSERGGDDSRSPDGKWRAVIRDHNLTAQPTEGGGEAVPLSTDGTAENAYTGPFRWSPDSKKVVAFRVKKVSQRQITIVQSSPPDQVQPKLRTLDYTKPGDPIRQPLPHLFDVEKRQQVPVDSALFANPWEISELAWADDSSEFTFIYNQRGHQVMRMVGVRGDSGSARTVFEDTSKTFIDYSQKFYLRRLPGSREILWASERDGHNHLYRIDGSTGEVKNRITQGNWNVREVIEVDDDKRQLLIKAVGVGGQNPYQEHFARVNFDGSGFTRLTESDGNHRIEFSPDKKFLLATWSRVDQPPVVELRNADTGKLIAELERADDAELVKTGWSRPERFVSKGRDGKTDIFGIIIRPTHFDASKKYPVVEDIYAGPHDQFVPKSFFTWSGKNAMAELGFIIVSIDGMGTNWRNREFHDVAWKNLADGGFPDRVPWIKAAAATRPWMDVSRVGIYGGSAGGQNAMAGLLHHGDFYKVGVADCGCHDNRMDKIWWNEAWMGWPVDESYARASNVTHADKLKGKVMLIVGELDSNVDPASTAQVLNALQKADKNYEYVPVMNANHGAAETPYGSYRRAEFLVRHLTGGAAAD